jgi:hypothetical protein
MSETCIASKTCADCTGYDRTKTGCYYKPYSYFWGAATLVQVEPTDPACHLYKAVELPVLSR